jgi:hypothetical protein
VIQVLVRADSGTPTGTTRGARPTSKSAPRHLSVVRAKIGPGSTWGIAPPGVYRLWAAVDTGAERVLVRRSSFRVKA